jgi:ornithine carbamoyltransferase
MKSSLNYRWLQLGDLSEADAQSLVDTALALKQAAQAGAAPPLLAGKNIALLSTDPQGASAAEFSRAASALGARVSRIEPDAALLAADGGSLRMLARLYDAIECDGLPQDAAQRLQRLVGVPVYNGLARNGHGLGALLPRLAPASAEDPLYLVQAVLVQTVA